MPVKFVVLFGAAGRPGSLRRRPAPMQGLDEFWADLLSGDSRRVQSAWGRLTDEERSAVLDHLAHMRDDPGWHLVQRQSAVAALHILGDRAR